MAEVDTDRFRQRRWHLLITAPAAAFVLAHLLGRTYPPELWGADMLAYYGPLTTAVFIALPLITLTLPALRLPTFVQTIGSFCVRTLRGSPFAWLLFAAAVPLLWLLRVRVHTLGDSLKWFAVVDNAVRHHRPFEDMSWHSASLGVAGLEFINVQQALDLVLHTGVYALLHATGIDDPQVSYRWISLLAGGAYLATLWALSRRLTATPQSVSQRLAIFGSVATLGTLQLFCGYGESYTLVTLLGALYLICALDGLHLHRPLWHAGAVLAVAAATHVLAASLGPSFLFLIWQHPRWGPVLRRRQVHVPLLLVAAVVAVLGYVGFYSAWHLPLLTPDQPGQYPILSLRHVANLGNALLLTGPFGLWWGLGAMLWRQPSCAAQRLLGLAAIGTTTLICIHFISLGGRDWDLLSFPTLFIAAWGLLALQGMLGPHTARGLARVVIPVMAVHTLLWVGINADAVRTDLRLHNLLQGDANLPNHYRAWILGCYYLEHGRAEDAVDAFANAVAQAPEELLNTPGTREFSYRKFYAGALSRARRDQQALIEFRHLYALQTEPYAEASDVAAHGDWARAAWRMAESTTASGDSAQAAPLWNEARLALTRLASWQDTPASHHDLATVLFRLGRHDESVTHRFLGIAKGQDAVQVMVETGDMYLGLGRPNIAAAAYGRLLGLGTGSAGLDAAQFRRIGIRLHKANDADSAILAFRQAVALEPSSAENHRNLGWLLLLRGDADGAVAHLHVAVDLLPNAEIMFTYAFACLAAGQLDLAANEYSAAVEAHGVEGGRRVGAPDNLDWLIDQGIQPQAARTMRDSYWQSR